MKPFNNIISYHLNFYFEVLTTKVPRGVKFNYIFRIVFISPYLLSWRESECKISFQWTLFPCEDMYSEKRQARVFCFVLINVYLFRTLT